MDIIVTAASNTYGPNQFNEKFIPKTISHIMEWEDIPIHGSGQYMREWLFVEDHCNAVELLGKHGISGEIYNIGGFVELQNKDVAIMVLEEMNKQSDIKYFSELKFTKDRPFNDRRY
jgi:dTDP-glucose 4,6-dehydratase